MAEFLGNLVTRSMSGAANSAEAEILRPRLPALFEGPGRVDGMAMSIDDRGTAPGEGIGEVPWQRLNSDKDQIALVAQEMPSGFIHRTEPFPPATSQETLSHRHNKANQQNVDLSHGEWDRLDEDKENAQSEGVRRLDRDTQGNHRHIQLGQEVARDSLRPIAPFAGRQDETSIFPSEGLKADREASRTPGKGLTIRPRIDPYQGVPEKLSAVSVAPLSVEENSRPVADQYSQSAREAQVPSVHISIGRIEVRAITQPAPQPTPRPTRQQPRLGLDDYLRQRNEGKR